MFIRRRVRPSLIRPWIGRLLAAGLTTSVLAQAENPVYIDDSPHAHDMLERALGQASENTGESVRLLQELLDDFRHRLVPVHDGSTLFVSLHRRVTSELASRPELLARYRIMQQAEAERLLALGAYDDLVATRHLTTAGLEALLRLAQHAVESAQFDAARHWITLARTHPDLDDATAAHLAWMDALVARFDASPMAARTARTALQTADAKGELIGALDAIEARGDLPPQIDRGASTLDVTATRDLGDLVSQSIWSYERTNGSDAPSARSDDLFTTTPSFLDLDARSTALVAEDVVYLNLGDSVHAFDRFTGRPIWPRPFEDSFVGLSHTNETASALALMSCEADYLVALTGNPGADRMSQIGSGRLVCLHARTGQERWSVHFNRLDGDDEYEGLFPHGRPLIHDGRVLTLARKVTAERLLGCYLVALDLETGATQWVRHLASSGARSNGARPLSLPTLVDGVLYVASPIGVACAVDAVTGDILWLTRSSVPVGASREQRSAWEVGGPVVHGEHVVLITPDDTRIEVRDRVHGHLVRTHAAATSNFQMPRYLIADEHHLYAIGDEVRAFDHRDPEWTDPVWTFPPRQTTSSIDGAPSDTRTPARSFPDRQFSMRTELVGRVQATKDGVLVPTARGVHILDPELGREGHVVDATLVGTPVATDAQLVIAARDGAVAYMSLHRADEMIRRRIADAPADPAPALSLLRLGARVNDLDLALEAGQLTLDALTRAGTAESTRFELFQELLQLHQRDRGARLRTELYVLLEQVARSTPERVEYQLALAEALAMKEPRRAVATYRALLSDATASNTMREEGGVHATTRRWATVRLEQLIATNESALMPEIERAARTRLDAVRSAGADDPVHLLEVARQYPFAAAGFESATDAAMLITEATSPRAAIGELIRLYEIAPVDRRASALLGTVIDLAMAAGDDAYARDLMQAAEARHGADLPLALAAGSTTIGAWRRSHPSDRGPARRPRLGALGRDAVVMDGRVIEHHPSCAGALPTGHVLMLQDEMIALYADPSLRTPRWEVPAESSAVSILAAGPDELLLYIDGQNLNRDPRVIALDPQTGEERWLTPRLDRFERGLPPLGEPRPAGGAPHRLGTGLVLPLVSDDRIVLVCQNGTVVAFDRRDGTHALWSVNGALKEVHRAVLHPHGIVLAGVDAMVAGGGSDDAIPRIVVLDPDADGAVTARSRPLLGANMLWLDVNAFGEVMIGSTAGVEWIELYHGTRHAANLSHAVMETNLGVLRADVALVQSRPGRLMALSPTSGRIIRDFDVDLAVRPELQRTLNADALTFARDHFVAHYRNRVLFYDHAGELIGADVVLDDSRRYVALVPIDDGYIVVSQADHRQIVREANGQRGSAYTYRFYHISNDGRLIADVIALDQPLRAEVLSATAIDGALLLTTRNETIVMPAQ